jgi:hypothetical protein
MTEILFRRGTAATWTATNPVLQSGEPGFEVDTGNMKVGNGTSPWTALPYETPQGGTTAGTFAVGNDTRFLQIPVQAGEISGLLTSVASLQATIISLQSSVATLQAGVGTLQSNSPANTAVPVISTPSGLTVGSIITVSNGSWTNTPTYGFQWKRNTTIIAGATNANYTLVTADVGDTLTCTVTATNAVGSSAITTAATGVITPVTGLPPSTATLPTITGTPAYVGAVLTVNQQTWVGSPTLTNQWNRNGAAIAGATGNTYTVQSADVGTSLTVSVKGVNSFGQSTATSAGATGLIALPVFTAITPPTGIVGTAYSYTFVATGATSYALNTGSFPTSLSFNTTTGVLSGVPTTAALTSTFTLSATNSSGPTVSSSISLIIAGAPQIVSVPVISGIDIVGSLLTVTNGTWS